ncbi:hypothetical protein U1Q18_040554 [Sarracenia purpurea var. burkii]
MCLLFCSRCCPARFLLLQLPEEVFYKWFVVDVLLVLWCCLLGCAAAALGGLQPFLWCLMLRVLGFFGAVLGLIAASSVLIFFRLLLKIYGI